MSTTTSTTQSLSPSPSSPAYAATPSSSSSSSPSPSPSPSPSSSSSASNTTSLDTHNDGGSERDEARRDVVGALKGVKGNIQAITKQLQLQKEPRLVAVSKTKPSFLVQLAYEAGQRNFGENYILELVSKAQELSGLADIRWHFIGHLQSNKCKQLAGVTNLYMVETVDSQKIADMLNKSWTHTHPLNIMIQVNTSGEESKSGLEPGEALPLVQHVINECHNLKFCGLMTIGRPSPPPDQPDFKQMVELKKVVCEKAGLSPDDVELSMGMSSDYKVAIEMGSTNVRVGSVIFGERDYTKK